MPSPIFSNTFARRAANSSLGSAVENSGGPSTRATWLRSLRTGCAETVASNAASTPDVTTSRLRFIASDYSGRQVTPFDSPDFAALAQGRPFDPLYPHARVDPFVETLHGVPVLDPYRWLEDAASPETRAWVDAQNVLTRSVLDGPARDVFVRELTGCFDYPRTVAALGRGNRFF